jgi:tight adherence protein B
MPIAGAMLLAFGIFQIIMDLRSSERRKVMDRLNENGPSKREMQVRESLLRKSAQEFQGNILESMVARLKVVHRVQKLLDQADVDWSAPKVMTNVGLIALVGGGALAILGFSITIVVVTFVALIGLPLLWLMRKRKKRGRRLVEQLPEVFDLMGQALRAGHSLAGAIQLISQQMPDPVATEFARVFHEQNLGIQIEEALLNMTERVDQMDVRFFVTAVLIQRQTGGDLAEVLDKIGKVIRDRIALFGTVKALTAEGRLSGWVLLLLPVFVFLAMMFVNPAYARQLTDTDDGRMLLTTAIAMDLMGMAMIRKIVNIKV